MKFSNNYKLYKEIKHVNDINIDDPFWFIEGYKDGVWRDERGYPTKAILRDKKSSYHTGKTNLVYDIYKYKDNKWIFKCRHNGYDVRIIDPPIVVERYITNYPKEQPCQLIKR